MTGLQGRKLALRWVPTTSTSLGRKGWVQRGGLRRAGRKGGEGRVKGGWTAMCEGDDGRVKRCDVQGGSWIKRGWDCGVVQGGSRTRPVVEDGVYAVALVAVVGPRQARMRGAPQQHCEHIVPGPLNQSSEWSIFAFRRETTFFCMSQPKIVVSHPKNGNLTLKIPQYQESGG